MYIIAIPLLIYDFSRSALAMSTMRAIEFFPNIFIGILAGVFVDRLNRKRMMQWTSLIRAASMLGIVLLLIRINLHFGIYIFLDSFYLRLVIHLGMPIMPSFPQIVTKAQLTSANAKLSFVNTFIQTIGPGFGRNISRGIYLYDDIDDIHGLSIRFIYVCLSFPTTRNRSYREKE